MNTYKTESLENSIIRLRDLQEKRENYYSERSDTWKAGEKGEAFEFRTQELEGIIDDLENAVDQLVKWNEEG